MEDSVIKDNDDNPHKHLLCDKRKLQGRIQDFKKVSQNFLINFQHSHI